MENTYYVHDPDYEKLIVVTTQIGTITDEEQLKCIAEDNGMNWSNCSWGGVRHFDVSID